MANLDVNNINLSVLKQYQSNFENEKNSFSNLSYRNFSNSYLKRCTDTYVSKMASKINKLYKEIEEAYESINDWWESYNKDAENLERCIMGTSSPGAFDADGLRTYAQSALYDLEDYNNDYVMEQLSVGFDNLKTDVSQVREEVITTTTATLNATTTFLTSQRETRTDISAVARDASDSVSASKVETVQVAKEEPKKEEPKKEQKWWEKVGSYLDRCWNIHNQNQQLNTQVQAQTNAMIGEAVEATGDFLYDSALYIGAATTEQQLRQTYETSQVMGLFNEDYAISEDTLNSQINSVWSGADQLAGKDLRQEVNKANATVALATNSLAEGIAWLGESIFDGMAIMGTMMNEQQLRETQQTSMMMGLIDEKYVMSDTTVNNMIDATWEGTRDLVEKEYVTDFFDNFYEENPVGSYIYNNAYAADTVRSTFKEVGYFGGSMALSATGIPMEAITGLAGLGRYTSDAWNDGASTKDGLAYGTCRAVFDIVEVGIGKGISKVNIAKYLMPNGSAFGRQLLNTVSHTLLDTADGTMSAFADPLFMMLYMPTEQKVEEILNSSDPQSPYYGKTWEELSFKEKYSALYEYNGGNAAVLTQALSAFTLSGLGEFGDLRKASKIDNLVKNVDVNAKTISNEYIDLINKMDGKDTAELLIQANKNGNITALSRYVSPEQFVSAISDLDSASIKGFLSNYDFSLIEDSLDEKSIKKILDAVRGDENYNWVTESLGFKYDIQAYEAEIKAKEALKELKKLKSQQYSLPKFIEGYVAAGYGVFGHFVYTPLTNNIDLCNTILDKGITHFTSEAKAKMILESGYVKKSNIRTSYGNKKSFFFGGEPDFRDAVSNLDNMLYKRTGVKINIDETQLGDFRYRPLNDLAVTFDGDFHFDTSRASQVYSVLKVEDGNLVYKQVTKAEYDAYVPSDEIKKIVRREKNILQAVNIGFGRQADYLKRDIKKLFDLFSDARVQDVNAKVSTATSLLDEYIKVDDFKLGNQLETLDDNTLSLKTNSSLSNASVINQGIIDLSLITKDNLGSTIDEIMKNQTIFESFIEKLKSNNVVEFSDFGSMDELKREIVKYLKESKKINDISPYYRYLFTTDSVMFSELIGSEVISDFTAKNIILNPKLLVPTYSNLTTDQFNILFDSEAVRSVLNEANVDDIKKLLSFFNKSDNSLWLNNKTITDKILSFSTEEFYSLDSFTISNAIKKLNREQNNSNFYNFLAGVESKFFNKDIFINEPQLLDKAGYMLPYLSFSDVHVERLQQQISAMKNEINVEIKKNVTSNSDVDISNNFTVNNIESDKYHTIIYEVDGVEYSFDFSYKIDGPIDLLSFLNSNKLMKEAYEGRFKIKDVKLNEIKNKLVFTREDGAIIGINKLKLLIDGKEEVVLIKTSKGVCDLNAKFEEADNVILLSIESIDSKNIDIDVSNKDKIYAVNFEIDGIISTRYFMPEKKLFEDSYLLDIDSYLVDNNLDNYKVIDISEFDLTNMDRSSVDILSKESLHTNLFNEIKYGGNQSDVSDLVSNMLSGKSLSKIEMMKANLLIELTKKYFPNATDVQIKSIAEHYASSGCNYMAVANAFVTYIGEDANAIRLFKEKFGYDIVFTDDNSFSYNVEAIAYEEYLNNMVRIYNDDIESMVKVSGGVSIAETNDAYSSFFQSKGINVEFDIPDPGSGPTDINLIKNIINNSKGFSVLNASGFDLEQLSFSEISNSSDAALANSTVSGNIIKNVGGHAMLVTGIDNDNNIIVSSWGRKYKFSSDSIQGKRGAFARIVGINFKLDE